VLKDDEEAEESSSSTKVFMFLGPVSRALV